MKAKAGIFEVLVSLTVLCATTSNMLSLADETRERAGLSHDFTTVMENKAAKEKTDQAELFLVHGQLDEAYKEYSKQIAAHPEKVNLTTRMHRMVCSSKLKRWQQVIDDGDAILKSHEGGVQNRSKVRDRRGLAYVELKKYDLACADFEEEARLWPDSRKAFVQLVHLYTILGKKSEAATTQKKLDQLDNDIQPF